MAATAIAPTTHVGHVKGIAGILGDKIHLEKPTSELLQDYKSAKPFPYLVLDNLFPNETHASRCSSSSLRSPTTSGSTTATSNSVKSNLRSAVDLGPAWIRVRRLPQLRRIPLPPLGDDRHLGFARRPLPRRRRLPRRAGRREVQHPRRPQHGHERPASSAASPC
jgi:hypothetical protein